MAARGQDDIVNPKGSALAVARSRLWLFMGVFVFAFSVVALRVTYLSLLRTGEEPQREALASAATSNAQDALAMGRADIVDRNGVLLATMVQANGLYVDPKDVANAAQLAKRLALIFPEIPEKTLLSRVQSKGRFTWIKHGLTPAESDAVLKLGDPSLNVRREPRRFYPQGELTAHILGYMSQDGQALSGLERGLDDKIQSSPTPIRTTIDVRVQHAVRKAVAKAIADYNAKSGSGVVMDANTGEIIASVSLPDFDPNHVGEVAETIEPNHFGQDVYELGSTFKLFTAAAQLDRVNGSFNQWQNASHPLIRGRFKIGDLHAKGRLLSLPEIVCYSSNIGSALMGEGMGDKYVDFLKKLGVLEPLKTELAERATPIYSKEWRPIEIATASYGHGIAVSVLHLARGVAALSNGGILPTPTFLPYDPDLAKDWPRVIRAETSDKVRELMRLVVTVGSGKRADVRGYMVGGKTGTSDKNINGRYVHDRRMSSFVGAFPMNKPKYVVAVSVDEPKGDEALGGYVSAPAVRSIVEAMVDLYGIPPVPEAVDMRYAHAVMPYLKDDAVKLVAYHDRHED